MTAKLFFMMEEIWAIILAAGESKRMKFPKMLLPLKDKTMIEKVVENVTGSEVFNTLVVLGSYSNEILGVIRNMPVVHCYNEKYKDGMVSSVQCGFRNLPAKFRAVLVFAGDQPLIEPDVINRVIRAYKRSGKGIVIPVYRSRRGHPLLLDSKYKNDIYNLDPETGLRSIAEKYPGDVFEIPVNSPGILKDFDTKEDYLNEINQKE